MPLYEYICSKCRKKKEMLRKLADRNKPVKCRKCKVKMKRVPSTQNFKLIGDGFYKPSKGG